MKIEEKDMHRFYEKVSTIPDKNGCLNWLAAGLGDLNE